MVQKTETPPSKKEILKEFFQKIGRKGGKTRAKKYDKEQLQEWARKGGRPRTTNQEEPAA